MAKGKLRLLRDGVEPVKDILSTASTKANGSLYEVAKKIAEPAPVAPAEPVVVAKASLYRKLLSISVISFILLVVMPTATTSIYMTFIARDQFASTSSFAVRSIDGASASDLLGLFSQSSSSSTTADSFILINYISSQTLLQEVKKNFDLEKLFGVKGYDYFFSLSGSSPIERQLQYWNSMVHLDFDHSSGILTLQVKAFSAEQAQLLSQFILKQSDKLINNLSKTAHDEILAGARAEMQSAEVRLANSKQRLRDYRDLAQEVDPTEGAKIASQLVGELESKRADLEATLRVARSQTSDDAPQVRVLASQMKSLEQQIEMEKQRLGSGDSSDLPSTIAPKKGRVDIAQRLLTYESLQTEGDFAERAYTAAMASMEKANVEARSRERYLAAFVSPTIAENAEYPRRLMDVIIIFGGGIFLWLFGTMLYFNIKDRA